MRDIEKLWMRNPGEVEAMASELTDVEKASVKKEMKALEEKTGLIKIKSGFSRVLGEGLIHREQVSTENISADTIYGKFVGTPAEVAMKIEALDLSWYESIGISNPIDIIWNQASLDLEVRNCLKSNKDRISKGVVDNLPIEAVSAMIKFIWEEIDEEVGSVSASLHGKELIVITDRPAQLIGKKGATIEKISSVVGYNIKVESDM